AFADGHFLTPANGPTAAFRAQAWGVAVEQTHYRQRPPTGAQGFAPCQPTRTGQCSPHPIRQDAIMASKTSWAAFPHDAKAYAHAGDALKKAWPKLHAGDCEPYPDDKRAAALLRAAGKATPKLDAPALATALQDAWRDFHRGDFKAAFDAGSALGPVGTSVAAKAMGIHA